MPSFKCANCEFSKTVSESFIGRRVKCPKCSFVSVVVAEVVSDSEQDVDGFLGIDLTQLRDDESSTEVGHYDQSDEGMAKAFADVPDAKGSPAAESTQFIPPATNDQQARTNTKLIFALISLATAIVAAGWSVTSQLMKPVQWEYMTVEYLAETSDSAITSDQKALSYKTVEIKAEEMNKLGAIGWELVSTFVEIETSHPNFGKGEYVTGLQPNVRTQRLVCIYKRRVRDQK